MNTKCKICVIDEELYNEIKLRYEANKESYNKEINIKNLIKLIFIKLYNRNVNEKNINKIYNKYYLKYQDFINLDRLILDLGFFLKGDVGIKAVMNYYRIENIRNIGNAYNRIKKKAKKEENNFKFKFPMKLI